MSLRLTGSCEGVFFFTFLFSSLYVFCSFDPSILTFLPHLTPPLCSVWLSFLHISSLLTGVEKVHKYLKCCCWEMGGKYRRAVLILRERGLVFGEVGWFSLKLALVHKKIYKPERAYGHTSSSSSSLCPSHIKIPFIFQTHANTRTGKREWMCLKDTTVNSNKREKAAL